MKDLIMNYSSLLENDTVALCFFDSCKGITLTACLCTGRADRNLSYTINERALSAEFYYSQTKNVGQRVVNFNYFKIELTEEMIYSSIKITFGDSLSIATFSSFPIDKNAMSYHICSEHILYFEGNSVILSPLKNAPLKKIKQNHRTAMKQCFKKDKSGFIKALIIRLSHCLASPFFKKEIWLIADRKDVAGDNGESFFEYLSKNPQKGVKPYFVINRSSKDLKRIKKIGRVLHPRTFKYKLYFTFATRIIASQLEYDIVNPILARSYLKDILNKCKVVFLQHGVTKDDVSKTYNRYERPIDIFTTVTRGEYQSIINNHAYGYGKEIVKLTGFSRFDKLESEREKIIFICPSWRKYCLKNTDTREPVDNVEDMRAVKLYRELLTNNALLSKAEGLGYKLCFYPHYMMEKCFEGLDLSSPVFVNSHNYSYADMFKKGALLMTDYSSVQFDFAYLKKPVIYCQPDREEFFASHTYVEGYFEYERDGFGEVCYDCDTLVSLLCDYIENDCKLKDEYKKRIDSTFKFRDKENCKRILDEVLKLDNGKNN